MLFTTDKQTLDDLGIFVKRSGRSIFELFNNTQTIGGAVILNEMFQYPLSDCEKINSRVALFQYFTAKKITLPVKADLCNIAEEYLSHTDERSRLDVGDNSVGKRISNMIAEDSVYKNIYKGVTALITILQDIRRFTDTFNVDHSPAYQTLLGTIRTAITTPAFDALQNEKTNIKLSFAKVAAYDVILRFRYRETIKDLLRFVYELDVYIAVGKSASANGFTFPKALTASPIVVRIDAVYHPELKNAVANDLEINADGNVIFLTGANMAGKSTFMKTLGIAMYLAHMGFPVAAKAMEFSVMDGIYTTINLPDNLGIGASHFYAEVLRVKKVAKELSQSKKLLIIFDELFRGTNVKDAYEATVALTAAFAKKRNSMFVISTHIVEAGPALKEKCNNIAFSYLPTRMNNGMPVYTYQLAAGITDDRHGMVIVNNEGIIEMLKNGKIPVK